MITELASALRALRSRPGWSLLVLTNLSLALAVSVSAFSVIEATMLRTFGVPNPETIHYPTIRTPNGFKQWTFAEFWRFSATSKTLAVEALIYERATSADLETTLSIAFVTPGYLSSFGAIPVEGRLLAPDAGAVEAVLSHRTWQRLGGKAELVGSRILLAGTPVTVVGVVGRTFTGPTSSPPDIWLPLATSGHIYDYLGPFTPDSDATVDVTAKRLVSSIAEVEKELEYLTPLVVSTGQEAASIGLIAGDDRLTADDRSGLYAALALILTVCLVACANTANVITATSVQRREEWAVRSAVGATTSQIIRPLWLEACTLASGAGVFGLLLSKLIISVLQSQFDLLGRLELSINLPTLFFTAGLIGITVLGSTLGPSWRTAKESRNTLLNGRHCSPAPALRRSQRLLVGIQVAVAGVATVVAVTAWRAVAQLDTGATNLGLETLASVSLSVVPKDYSSQDYSRLWRSVTERSQQTVGLTRWAFADAAPFAGGHRTLWLTTRSGDRIPTRWIKTSASYFDTLNLTLVAGRVYSANEVVDREPVAIISEDLARRYWPDVLPINETLDTVDQSLTGLKIIGVVQDARLDKMPGVSVGAVFSPLLDWSTAQFIFRTVGNSAVMTDSVVAGVSEVDRRVEAVGSLPLEGFNRGMALPRLLADGVTTIALLLLLMALAGVVSAAVLSSSQRARECVLRVALGGLPSRVALEMCQDSLRPSLYGVLVGLTSTIAGATVLRAVGLPLPVVDPLVAVVAAIILVGTVVVASLLPTLRLSLRFDQRSDS